MRYVSSVTVAARVLVSAAIVALGGPGLVASAQSGRDNVQVMVCPQPSESSLTVAAPQSDSVVDKPKVPLTGMVEYISQIDFFIDGTYNHTQALGYAATSFTSAVTISPGTHTLKLVASDSCSQTTHEQTIIITYESKVLPSIGAAVPTAVDDRLIETEVAESVPGQQTPLEEYVLPPLMGIMEALDLTDPPTETEPISPLPSAGRAALFVAGAAVALTGTYVATAATLPTILSSVLPYRRWFGVGALAVAAALLGVVFTL